MTTANYLYDLFPLSINLSELWLLPEIHHLLFRLIEQVLHMGMWFKKEMTSTLFAPLEILKDFIFSPHFSSRL